MKKISIRGLLIVKILPNGRCAELVQPVTARWGHYRVTVHRGFQTDFASVPKIFWSIIPPMGRYSLAAVIHDYAYQYPGVKTKKQCDTMFYDLMLHLGVSGIKAKIMYRAVKWFGGGAWKSYRKDKCK